MCERAPPDGAHQIAYWDRVFAALVKTRLEERPAGKFLERRYADAKSTRRRLDHEYAEYKAILTELGVAK
ncbi:MAG: hypothetical protein JWN13_2777 [Betaproteobacteria bacterium]|jgi:hypothetical protein|nr:hypothetical protein [Betaproteobacteria bacterium]